MRNGRKFDREEDGGKTRINCQPPGGGDGFGGGGGLVPAERTEQCQGKWEGGKGKRREVRHRGVRGSALRHPRKYLQQDDPNGGNNTLKGRESGARSERGGRIKET